MPKARKKTTRTEFIKFLLKARSEYFLKDKKIEIKDLNLNDFNLRCLDFSNAIISNVSFVNTDLTQANFSGSRINNCEFKKANIGNSNFLNSYLDHITFDDCDLTYSNFCYASLRNVVINGGALDNLPFQGSLIEFTQINNPTLSNTIFLNAHVSCSEINANLSNSILKNVTINKVVLGKDAKLPPMDIPESGQFTVWKKVLVDEPYRRRAILKLRVPPKARRMAALKGKKCRVEYARVISAEDIDGKPLPKDTKLMSAYNNNFKYKIGEIVRANKFDGDRFTECSNGINCFLHKQDAIDYGL